MDSKKVLGAVAALAVVGVVTTGATGASAGPSPVRTVAFTNQMDGMVPVDVAPAGPSAGDQFYIHSHSVTPGVAGGTVASCVLTKVVGGGVRQCEIDFLLADGIITTRGFGRLDPSHPVKLVITGGTKEYAGASGRGLLTPIPGGSQVSLRVR